MKTNVALHNKIGFQEPAQKAWYAAHVLKAALTNSPAIAISPAVAAVAARPAIIAQTAKPARAATAAVLGTANTTGYTFGQLYLNSPAYPIGTAIPAIPGKPASAAVAASPAIVAVPAVAAISSPAVTAVLGWADAITITKTQATNLLIVVAELPIYQGVGIVGSQKSVIGEITPTALQASSFVDVVVSATGQSAMCVDNAADTTLEQVFYRNALLYNGVIEDVTRTINGVAVSCKRITFGVTPPTSYDFNSNLMQLPSIFNVDANPN